MPIQSEWRIKVGEASSATPKELGVRISTINLRSQATSSATLSRIAQFDEATDLFTYDTVVVISNAGTTIFRGKIKSNPRNANPDDEGQEIEILDVWDDLERTVYQELWGIGPDSEGEPRNPLYQPRAILGLNSAGDPIPTNTQLGTFIAYAQNQAEVGIQMGTCPAGLSLWPSQVDNMTVAELIRNTLKFHPDWVTQMNYSSSPVTVNFLKPAFSGGLSIALDGSDDVVGHSVRQVSERVPECVAITYETSMRIDDNIYRDLVQDIYPTGGNPRAPGCLSVTVPLESGNIVTMKQPIETVNMPTNQAEAKTWLKLKFPSIAEVPDLAYNVTKYQRTLVPDGEQPDPPVNEEDPRLEVLDFDELPRELVRGTIQDWMKKKVRKVEVIIEVEPTEAAKAAAFDDPENAALLAKLPSGENKIVVTCTNAITKVYKGTSSFTPAENAPTGIAQAVYESLSQTQFEGSITLGFKEIPNTIFFGRELNLTGGRSEWQTMAAMISAVQYDLDAGQVSLAFGPPPFLAPGDWLEMQRSLRGRQPTWITNRDSDEPRDGGPEISGSYDTPNSETLPGSQDIFHPFKVTDGGLVGEDPEELEQSYNVAKGFAGGIEIAGGSMIVTDGYVIYVKVQRNVASRAVIAATREAASELPASDNVFQYVKIAKVSGGRVEQHRFEDIRLTELLIQDAGEVFMVSFFDSTNLYALPEPPPEPEP